MTYAEKLKDPRWQKKRLEIMQRDNFPCRHCHNGTETLHVHHTYYLKGHDPWDYPNEAYLTLCKECHEDIGNAQSEFVQAFSKLNLSAFDLACLADALNEGQGLIGSMAGPALAEFFKYPEFQQRVINMFEAELRKRYPDIFE